MNIALHCRRWPQSEGPGSGVDASTHAAVHRDSPAHGDQTAIHGPVDGHRRADGNHIPPNRAIDDHVVPGEEHIVVDHLPGRNRVASGNPLRLGGWREGKYSDRQQHQG